MKLFCFPFVLLARLMLICSSFAAQAKDGPERYVFKNGYGKIISMTDFSVVVDGKHYPAKSCSLNGIKCVKYGSAFAIMAPFFCDAVGHYKWSGAGVTSFLMAVTPHDDSNVLLSTTYGGWVSFSYGSGAGITALYYYPKIKIGVKEIWYSKDYVDTKRVVYNKISAGKLMPCSK